MKKGVLTILIFIFLFAISGTTFAQEKIEINFFFSPSCHYCAQEKEFLNTLEKKYPELEIKRFNTFEKESVKLLKKLYQEYKVPLEEQGWVPITFTPKEYFLSFNEKIAKDIENCILECKLTEPRESPAEETPTMATPAASEPSPTSSFGGGSYSSDTIPNQTVQTPVQPAQVGKKSGGKALKIILIVVIALLLAGGATYFYLKNKKANESAKSDTTAATTQTAATPVTSKDVTQTLTNLDTALASADSANDTAATDLTDATLGL